MVLAQQKLIWLIAVLAVFLAFNKLKSGHFLYRSKALKLMAGGFFLLFSGTLVGMTGHMGLLGSGYSNSMLFFIIESVLGYVCGWALVIWGMALWLPYLFSVSSRLQKTTKSIRLYEAISRVATYGDASRSTFEKIASTAMENYGFQAASLHMMDKENRLSLFAVIGLTDKSIRAISISGDGLYEKVYKTGDIFQADDSIRLHKNLIIETAHGPVVEALAMPVDFGVKRVGVFTVYTDHPRLFTREEIRVLEAVCINLGLAFYRDGLQKSIGSHKAFRDLTAVILKSARSADNLNTRVIRLAKLLRQYLKFDTLNLYLFSSGALQVLDFNLPNGGKVIIEKGCFCTEDHLPTMWVLEETRSLILPDNINLLKSDYKPPPNLRSLYTPVVISGKAAGVLNVSIKANQMFAYNDIIILEAIASAISGSVLEEMYQGMLDESFERTGAIKYAVESLLNQGLTGDVRRELAKIVVENVPATFCRIMTYDKDNGRFNTGAIYQRRELCWDDENIGGLPFEELYAHRKVMATGKPEIVSYKDRVHKMSELEAKLLLPAGISQCLIVPIIVSGKAAGVMTVGESRKADRNELGLKQLVFAQMLSNVVSMTLRQKESDAARDILANSHRLANRRLRFFENQVDTIDAVSNFNSRLNGPLAGIMAACELLKTKPDIKKEELERYIDMVNKNAHKIHKLANQVAEAKRVMATMAKG